VTGKQNQAALIISKGHCLNTWNKTMQGIGLTGTRMAIETKCQKDITVQKFVNSLMLLLLL